MSNKLSHVMQLYSSFDSFTLLVTLAWEHVAALLCAAAEHLARAKQKRAFSRTGKIHTYNGSNWFKRRRAPGGGVVWTSPKMILNSPKMAILGDKKGYLVFLWECSRNEGFKRRPARGRRGMNYTRPRSIYNWHEMDLIGVNNGRFIFLLSCASVVAGLLMLRANERTLTCECQLATRAKHICRFDTLY